MSNADLTDWIGHFGRPGALWYAKRLSANDTYATEAHQAGPYIPKEFLFEALPSLHQPELENPDVRLNLYIDSHHDHQQVRAVWYNKRLHKTGTRNETRITNLGGANSALLDADSTGAIAAFAFVPTNDAPGIECHVWVTQASVEEDLLEERLGPIEPKRFVIWKPGGFPQADLFEETPSPRDSCWLLQNEIPDEWLEQFPTGEEIIRKTLELRPRDESTPDVRLIRRRHCEFEIFQSVEEAVYAPRIKQGFPSLESFLGLAQTVLQSRKTRSGTSLELHAREILVEEGLRAGTEFEHRPVIEGGKRPDFIFPTAAAYADSAFPTNRLRMLAAKTTCKDRWRQVLNEADRIRQKHLLTLQEGVSEGQFREMGEAGIILVVPVALHGSYPAAVRPHLVAFESFIGDLRLLKA